jgi:c-di-GMP-binding flagellar brake protein YcgR
MSAENPAEEKRVSPRVPLDVDLYMKVNKPPEVRIMVKDTTKVGHSVDVSENGISFLLDTELPKMTEVEIHFHMISDAKEQRKIEIEGEVRYCFPRRPITSYRIGVIFIRIDKDDRAAIIEYVKASHQK